MDYKRAYQVLTLLLAAGVALMSTSAFALFEEDEFLMPDEAFKADLVEVDGRLEARWQIVDGYYLYRDKLKFESLTDGVVLGEPQLPESKTKNDPNFGNTEVYYHALIASLPVEQGSGDAEVRVTYQGCAEKGLCYPPQRKVFPVVLAALATPAQAAPANDPVQEIAAIGDSLGFDDDLLPPEQAFNFDAQLVDDSTLRVNWNVADGIYLYADKMKLAVSGGATAGEFTFPAPEKKWGLAPDGTEGELDVYHGLVTVDVPLNRVSNDHVVLNAGYQGCAEIGICYPPQKKQLSFPFSTADASMAAVAQPVEPTPVPQTVDVKPMGPLCDDVSGANATFGNKGFWTIILSFFIIGALLSLTPCVFPMIPILSGIITGHSGKMTPAKGFMLSVIYVLAMAVTYTLAGIIAAKSGENLQVALQSPIALSLFAGLFVLLALSMFGFYELQLPSSLQSKLTEFSNKQKGGSYTGVAIMGFLSALIVGPCVAPPLAASLAYISQTGDVVLGGTALFVMSIGMGLPLLALGASAGKLLPRAGGWMDAVKAVFGVVMLAIGITMLERLAPTFIPAYLPMILWGLLLIASAIYMGALEQLPEGASGWRKLWKALGIAFIAWGAVVLIGAASGKDDPLQPLVHTEHVEFKRITTVEQLDAELAAARAAGKPVVLDFYADWCVYCKTMEREIFPHPLVQEKFEGKLLLQADVTSNTELMDEFGLVAPPTILLFDAEGTELCNYRMIGNVTVDQLLERLNAAGM
ncbi:protein-disulfide reductase DsbD [Solemya velum gill symbiont]|uniref:protein-disulfide reductase DsbD n=1 Tax=Solemya velum gill symbiont TaxID=2340 RepID=UPI001F21B1D8|nr:protein-disulfide reductase DsbD [Solemya velum gill symbiont]